MTPTCPSVPHLVNMHLYICSCQSYNLALGATLLSLFNDPFAWSAVTQTYGFPVVIHALPNFYASVTTR